jgi:hypothetical protein
MNTPTETPSSSRAANEGGADPTSLLTSAERLHLAISTMLKDWKDGDFVLPRLAEIHMEAVREKYLEVGQALAFGEKSFREFQAMIAAPLPPPTQGATSIRGKHPQWAKDAAKAYYENCYTKAHAASYITSDGESLLSEFIARFAPQATAQTTQEGELEEVIQERDEAEAAADKLASLVLGEAIDWSDHPGKWQEAIEEFSSHPQQPSAGQGEVCPECGGAKPWCELRDRIRNYFGNGGLFNPELMEHRKVSDLLMDIAKAIDQFWAPTQSARPIPPPPPATGEQLFKKRLTEEHAVSLDPEWGAGAKAYAVILPSPGIIIIGDDDGEVQLYRRRAAHLFKALAAMPENQAPGEPPAKEGETPRTHEVARMPTDAYPNCVVDVSFARQLERELHAAKAELAEANALFSTHTKAVGAFLNELYAIMVDPLADGTMEVSEIRAALLKAANEGRELAAADEGKKDSLRLDWVLAGNSVKVACGPDGPIGHYISTLHYKPTRADVDAAMSASPAVGTRTVEAEKA